MTNVGSPETTSRIGEVPGKSLHLPRRPSLKKRRDFAHWGGARIWLLVLVRETGLAAPGSSWQPRFGKNGAPGRFLVQVEQNDPGLGIGESQNGYGLGLGEGQSGHGLGIGYPRRLRSGPWKAKMAKV